MDVFILWAIIVLQPGITITQIRKRLGVRRNWVISRLTKMEQSGLRVCEDDEEKLYPYSRNGIPSRWLASQIGV